MAPAPCWGRFSYGIQHWPGLSGGRFAGLELRPACKKGRRSCAARRPEFWEETPRRTGGPPIDIHDAHSGPADSPQDSLSTAAKLRRPVPDSPAGFRKSWRGILLELSGIRGAASRSGELMQITPTRIWDTAALYDDDEAASVGGLGVPSQK